MNRILKVLFFSAISILAVSTYAEEVNPGTPDTIEQVRESAKRDRAQADGDEKRAEAYRELAKQQRQEAARRRDPSDKKIALDIAERREREAKELEEGATRLRDEAEEKEARANRLEPAYKEKYGPKPEAPPRREPASTSSPSSEAEWSVEDLVGLWARSTEPGFTLAIVPQFPDESAMVNQIEAHSDRHIWKGTFEKASREGPARAVLTYTPKADEVNPAIPDQARQAVLGKLTWRLELELAGDAFTPTLKAKWYPGEVRWTDHDLAHASVIGEGKPLEFAFEPIDSVNIESLSFPTVAIKLPNPAHDPDRDPIESLIKGQRFFVRVTLPVEMAREQGPKIVAIVRSVTSGDEENIELTGAIGRGQRPVVYSNDGDLTIADCQAMLEPRLNPPLLSGEWIFNKLYGVVNPGGCLNISVRSGEFVEVRYDDAAVRVPIYDSWVQRGIARHVQGATRLREVYESILSGPYEQTVKDAARKKLQMLANYDALRGSEKLTDLHRFFIGEAYLGDGPNTSTGENVVGTGGMPPALLQTENAALIARYREDVVNPPHVRPDTTYLTPLLQAALEGLTGKDLHPRAWTAGSEIVWTSEAEQFYVLREIRNTSIRQSEDVLKKTLEEFSFGIYDGVATGTGVGGLYLIATGKDHFNRPQPRWVRLMAAVNLASDAVLHLYGGRALEIFNEQLARLRRPTSGKTIRTGLIARGRRGISLVNGRAELPDVPKSVQGKKRGALTLELSPDAATTTFDECETRATKPGKPRTLPLADGASFADVIREAEEGPEKYVARTWGPGTEILPGDVNDLAGQTGPTCGERVASRAIHKATGKYISEEEGNARLVRILKDDVTTGKRKLEAKLAAMGNDIGYDHRVIRDYLVDEGAKVAESQRGNHRHNLRHVKTALKKGWMVKTSVWFNPNRNPHAVLIEDLVPNADGSIEAVIVYDPNVGLLKVPSARFETLFNRLRSLKTHKEEGLFVFIRFDLDSQK